MDPKLITFISPTVGDWIILKRFQQQKKAILYDPDSKNPEHHPGSLIVLGWPNGRAYPKLKFTEVVSDVETAKNAVIIKGIDVGEKKYKKIEVFASGRVVGTREERVPTIKQFEVHPATVLVTSSDAVDLEVDVDITIEMLKPLRALKIDDFLGFAATFVTEAYHLWASKKTYRENRTVKTSKDKKGNNVTVETEICDNIEKLNRTKFIPKGFRAQHISVVKITIAKGSEDVQQSEQQIIIDSNANLADIEQQKIALRHNETQKKINDTKVEFMKKELAVQADYVEKTSKAIAEQNKAWGEGGLKTLIINDPKNTGANQVQTIQVANVDN